MNDVDAQIASARLVKEADGEYVIAALVYSLSPIHDDAHYVENARRLAACKDVDALYIKDPGGLLLPQRARVLIPAIKAVIDGKALELHSHCTIGLAELAYMDAPDLGAAPCSALGAAPMARPIRHQDAWSRIFALGHGSTLTTRRWMKWAATSGWPRRKACLRARRAFDATYLHQLPGGVVSDAARTGAAKAQEGAVIEELAHVREELLIIVTPFAQMILTLAVMNVTARALCRDPRRGDPLCAESLWTPQCPLLEVMDRIMSLPREGDLAEPGFRCPSCAAGLEQTFPTRNSVRATMPARNGRSCNPKAAPATDPTMSVRSCRALCARRDLAVIVEKAGFPGCADHG
jgi:oxaloacetate decarboxylase alpha subunit